MQDELQPNSTGDFNDKVHFLCTSQTWCLVGGTQIILGIWREREGEAASLMDLHQFQIQHY